MGIELKDLQPGSYYKGYHAPSPQGVKCFYYVKSKTLKGAGVEVEVVRHFRNALGPAGWLPVTFTGPPNFSSLVKRPSTARDIKNAGLTFPVPKPIPVQVSVVPVEALTNAPVAAAAVKAVIKENANSPTCVKCGGANKAIVMFSSTSYTCTNCEPQ